jgi:hypothetical protein
MAGLLGKAARSIGASRIVFPQEFISNRRVWIAAVMTREWPQAGPVQKLPAQAVGALDVMFLDEADPQAASAQSAREGGYETTQRSIPTGRGR